jgi:hypothetical protein
MDRNSRVMEILRQAKILARKYREVTGKPLGITGEVAEFEAARLLKLKLTTAREPGYDAIEKRRGKIFKLQIKGRSLSLDAKPGQRLGSIDIKKEWDAVLMVLMDEEFNVMEIWEAPRRKILGELRRPGSISRNVRHAMAVSKFKFIGEKRWPKLGVRSLI